MTQVLSFCPACGRQGEKFGLCELCEQHTRNLSLARTIAMNLESRHVERRLGIPPQHSVLNRPMLNVAHRPQITLEVR